MTEDEFFAALEKTESGHYLPGPCDYARWAFFELWDEINGRGAWEKDPLVFAYTFKRI